MERLDKNLWYRVKRFAPQPNLLYDPITDNYRKTGVMRVEASTQPYAKYVSGTGDDKNIKFQLPRNNMQPILPQRTFKDLEPQSRVRGGLDLTKGERQQTKIIQALQGTSDLIKGFISTPKLNPDGSVMIDPVTNEPVMEQKPLKDIISVSQEALLKALSDQNVSVTNNVSTIIKSFTSVQIQNVLAMFRGIVRQYPNITPADKAKAFNTAIINERMYDLSSAPAGVEDAIGDELVEEKMTEFTANWDIPYTATMFPQMGFEPVQWNASMEAENQLKEYIMVRKRLDPTLHVRTVTGRRIDRTADIARQFAGDRLHIFNLRTFQFVRPPPDNAGRLVMAQVHT